MILQMHPKLNGDIQRNGCGFLSIIWHAVRKRRLVLESIDEINQLYDKIIPFGYMGENCFIYRWEKVFEMVGLPVDYTQRHEDPSRVCEKGEIEILRFPGHFVAGNGQGIVTYDSYGESAAIRTGDMRSKRIFKVLT